MKPTDNFVILAQFGNDGYPKIMKAYTSKFERQPGDQIRYENQVWQVYSTGFASIKEAHETMLKTAQNFVEEGIWAGAKRKKVNF